VKDVGGRPSGFVLKSVPFLNPDFVEIVTQHVIGGGVPATATPPTIFEAGKRKTPRMAGISKANSRCFKGVSFLNEGV
jgi:hypothetical protein